MLRAALLALLIACSSKSGTGSGPGTGTGPGTATAAGPGTGSAAVPGKWDCATDADCINSCEHGAVNRVWYDTTRPPECEDGCANQLAEAPRCIDQGCVAFHSDPQDSSKITRWEYCTRKK